jgi:hypothetical protein
MVWSFLLKICRLAGTKVTCLFEYANPVISNTREYPCTCTGEHQYISLGSSVSGTLGHFKFKTWGRYSSAEYVPAVDIFAIAGQIREWWVQDSRWA